MKKRNNFSNTLLHWYIEHKRELPWRDTHNPYLIWVSEVILQQTRVNQGLGYYLRFISSFPDIQALANASSDQVMKIWEGLGYYSRARNMHETAKVIVGQFNGRFPQKAEELEKLKGIGKYTASAIASMAFDQAEAVVDGNVIRFISRYFGIEKPVDASETIKLISNLANQLIDRDQPGLFNQAMMEFGALQCIPSKPDCLKCCFNESCMGYKSNKVGLIPIKAKKVKLTARYFNYLVIQCRQNGSTGLVIKKRTGTDIWKNLYDFPLIESDKLLDVKQLLRDETFQKLFREFNPVVEIFADNYRHLLTHRIIHACFFRVLISGSNGFDLPGDYLCVNNIKDFPLPKLINNFIADKGLIHY